MIRVVTEPSLALIKYWGKAEGGVNLPATSSIAVSLGGLTTTTEISSIDAPADVFVLNGQEQHDAKIQGLLLHLRTVFPDTARLRFRISTENSFPTAAGIASSSSGFAALAIGLSRAAGLKLGDRELSQLARHGSGSAARAVFGGFTRFPAGSSAAEQLYPHDHWPELRIVVVMVHTGAKPIGSRDAMEHTRRTSPYYASWVEASRRLEEPAAAAVGSTDLDELGPIMRRSYLSMFGSMLGADPGVVYWLPDSVQLIHRAAAWRSQGIPAWETMDAGPQVKLLTTAEHLPALQERLAREFPHLKTLTATVGAGPRVYGDAQA